MESSDNKKKYGIKRIGNSIKNSCNGLLQAYKNEQSMLLHFIASALLVFLSIYCKISRMEWLAVIGIIGLTGTIELLNTAIERVVDLATSEFHPLAKAAKDISSAAEFVLVIASTIIALLIFIPKWIP